MCELVLSVAPGMFDVHHPVSGAPVKAPKMFGFTYAPVLCGVNSFDYLIQLQRHARELVARPSEWMPWNYRETLAQVEV